MKLKVLPMNHIRTLKGFVKSKKPIIIVDLISRFFSLNDAPFEVALAAYKAYTQLGDPAQAELWLDRGLSLSPTDANLLCIKGNFHTNRREWTEAVLCLEQATQLRPSIAMNHGSLGYAFFKQAKYKKAIPEYRTALELDPTINAWWIGLGRSYLYLNKFNESADAFSRALKLKDDVVTRYQYEELLQKAISGSKEASSVYYDAVYSSSQKYVQPAEDSIYVPIWLRIQEMLQKQEVRSILDLGCGPGQFAEYISERLPQIQYTGLDFSSVAIFEAKKRCPKFLFKKRKLPISNFNDLPAFDSVVCTEVLEHVEQDIEILAQIPPATFIVASVPNFDSFGHVRIFLSEEEVRHRYDQVLDNLEIEGVALSKQTIIWLMSGIRSQKLPAT